MSEIQSPQPQDESHRSIEFTEYFSDVLRELVVTAIGDVIDYDPDKIEQIRERLSDIKLDIVDTIPAAQLIGFTPQRMRVLKSSNRLPPSIIEIRSDVRHRGIWLTSDIATFAATPRPKSGRPRKSEE